MMHGWREKSVVFVIVAALILSTTGFQAMAADQKLGEEAGAGTMVADFVLVRPFGIAATAIGTVFFIVSLPFSAAGGNTKAAFQKLVAEPAKFTFKRPLGKLEF